MDNLRESLYKIFRPSRVESADDLERVIDNFYQDYLDSVGADDVDHGAFAKAKEAGSFARAAKIFNAAGMDDFEDFVLRQAAEGG